MRHTQDSIGTRALYKRLFLCVLVGVFALPSFNFAEDDLTGVVAEVDETDAAAPVLQEDDSSEEPQAAKNRSLRPSTVEPRLGLRLRVEYDHQEQGDYSDNDLNGRMYAYAYDLFNKCLDVYVSMRLYHDLDSPSELSLDDDVFVSVDDTDGTTDDRLLQLYADFHNRDKTIALRAGRQYVEVADYLQIDGFQLKLNERETFGGRIYYGHPVSYYTAVSGDYGGGISLVGRPMEGNISRVTYARYYDDSVGDADNNYYLDLRQRFSETTRARGQCSYLNNELRMGRFDMYYISLDGITDIAAGASYWGTFDAHTRVYSPLYEVLGESQPYTYTYARLIRQIADDWYVSPGVSFRSVQEDDESAGNNNYEKYTLMLTYEPNRSFSTSLSLDHWSVQDGDSFSGVGGDIRYRKGRKWEYRVGALYAEYKYNTYSDLNYDVSDGQVIFSDNGTVQEESPYVYTYFVRAKWKMTKHLVLRMQFDAEDNDSVPDIAYRVRSSLEIRL